MKERLNFFKDTRMYQKEMGKQSRKVSDRFRKFIELWADKCRQYRKVSKESERQTLTTDIVTCEVSSCFPVSSSLLFCYV